MQSNKGIALIGWKSFHPLGAQCVTDILRAFPACLKALDQGGDIAWVQYKAEETQGGADKFICQKIISASHHIGNPLLPQTALQHVPLPMCAIQNRHIGKTPDVILFCLIILGVGVQHVDTAYHSIDFLRNKDGLRQVALRHQNSNRRATRFPGPKLPDRTLILRNHRQSTVQNFRCRAIVLEKANEAKRRKIVCEAAETTRIGAAESVDRLVGIPDYKKSLAMSAPGADQLILDFIDVLKLIDTEISKSIKRQ